MLTSALLSQIATIVGLMAGGIAVGGFLGHAGPSLAGRSDARLRRATAIGGLAGLGLALFAVVLSVGIR
jgi:hypothetical protein